MYPQLWSPFKIKFNGHPILSCKNSKPYKISPVCAMTPGHPTVLWIFHKVFLSGRVFVPHITLSVATQLSRRKRKLKPSQAQLGFGACTDRFILCDCNGIFTRCLTADGFFSSRFSYRDQFAFLIRRYVTRLRKPYGVDTRVDEAVISTIRIQQQIKWKKWREKLVTTSERKAKIFEPKSSL